MSTFCQRTYIRWCSVVGALLAYGATADEAAASSAGGSLPWDAPLQTLAADLTGPVASAISLIALFVAGAVLVFGEDLSHFARRALMVVISIAFLVLGAKFLSALGLAGATV